MVNIKQEIDRYVERCNVLYQRCQEEGFETVFPHGVLEIDAPAHGKVPPFADQQDAAIRRKMGLMRSVAKRVLPDRYFWRVEFDVISSEPRVVVDYIDSY